MSFGPISFPLTGKVKAILLLGVLSACGSGDSPLDTVAAVVTAPVTMPVMIIKARPNDR